MAENASSRAYRNVHYKMKCCWGRLNGRLFCDNAAYNADIVNFAMHILRRRCWNTATDRSRTRARSPACCKVFEQCKKNRRRISECIAASPLRERSIQEFKDGLLESRVRWRRQMVAAFEHHQLRSGDHRGQRLRIPDRVIVAPN